MGIYINGIDMPAHGIVIDIRADGRVSNHYDENCKQIATATAVPPHGDLIDRKALLKSQHGVYFLETLLPAVKNAPTIIPASEEGE